MVTRLELGRVVATPGAIEVLDGQNVSPLDLLRRHQSGDWGEVCKADARENVRALKTGLRVLSSYPVGGGKVWIITEADRSSTSCCPPRSIERRVRAKLLSRAGWTQKRVGEEVGLTQKAVGNLLSSFTDDPRNYYDLIDEAAAKYDEDVLMAAVCGLD